jgi:DNA polymerase-1
MGVTDAFLMPDPILALIDGHYYAYRFFFGMPPLTGPGGRPTGISYAYANLLRDLKQNSEITHWLAVFDTARSFRNDLDVEYKAHRDPTPELLATQLPDVRRLLAATGCPALERDGYEADDILATYAKQAAAAGFQVRLLTKDKDVDQVLSDRISTWDPGKGIRRGPAELQTEKGIRPDQVIDYLCMIGDSADNVPGIAGVGPKTAAKLLATYGSLAAVLANTDQLKGKQQENVRAFIPKAEHTRRMITLVDVPDLPALDTLRIDRSRGIDAAVYAEFGFSVAKFAKATPPPPPVAGAEPAVPAPPSAAEAGYRLLSLADLPEYLAGLRAAGRFAIDTETTGLDPHTADLVGVSFANGLPTPTAAAYLPLRAPDHTCPAWAEVLPLLKPLLEDAAVKKIGQNSKFDAQIFRHHGIRIAGYDGDPMLASSLLDPSRESHGLDHLTESFLGEPKIPTTAVIDLKAGQTMDTAPLATVLRYACEDAQCTWRLAQLLEGKLAANGLMTVYRTQELPIAMVLAEMEFAGIGVDRQVLANTQEHLQHYLTQVESDIRRHTGPEFNPASPKQVAQVLFERLKLPVFTSTKSGPSTDASVLESLRGLHELPDLLLQWRSLSKLIGTYLTKLPDYINPVTGRIHTHYKQTGTETGRLSSDQPNLQNIPKKRDIGREMRAAFGPTPGCLLIAADYSQIELRVLAHLSEDQTLLAAFHSGADIHRFVAAQVHHCDEASVTPAQRNAAKAVNFGIIYGQTAFGLASQLGIPRNEASQFIDGYFARFSSVKAFINRTVEEAAMRGYASTMAGRRRYLPQLSSGNRNERMQGERIALNSTIQGSAADLIKVAMLRAQKMLPADSQLLLQIHDELLVEAPAASAEQSALALTEAMTGAWQLAVPLIAEARIGRTWLDVS